MVRIIMILGLIMCLGCTQQPKRQLTVTDQFSAMVPDSAGHIYFVQDTSHFDFTVWSSDVLYKLHEPDFAGYMGSGDFIRFIWLRSFENPVVVRVNQFSDTVYANIKELGRREGELSIVKDRVIESWDSGGLSSEPLRNYLDPLIRLAEQYVNFHTAKGRSAFH